MPIRLRVDAIDEHGFTGREPHPPARLSGTFVTLLDIDMDPAAGDFFVYTVLADADNHIYQLVEHELCEAATVDHGDVPGLWRDA